MFSRYVFMEEVVSVCGQACENQASEWGWVVVSYHNSGTSKYHDCENNLDYIILTILDEKSMQQVMFCEVKCVFIFICFR